MMNISQTIFMYIVQTALNLTLFYFLCFVAVFSTVEKKKKSAWQTNQREKREERGSTEKVDNNSVMSYPSDISIFSRPYCRCFGMMWRCWFQFSFSLYIISFHDFSFFHCVCLSISFCFCFIYFFCKCVWVIVSVLVSLYNEHWAQVKNEFSSQGTRESHCSHHFIATSYFEQNKKLVKQAPKEKHTHKTNNKMKMGRWTFMTLQRALALLHFIETMKFCNFYSCYWQTIWEMLWVFEPLDWIYGKQIMWFRCKFTFISCYGDFCIAIAELFIFCMSISCVWLYLSFLFMLILTSILHPLPPPYFQ